MIKTIHQYSSSAADGDGVTNSLFFMQSLLQRLGFESQIYCHHVPDELKHKILAIEEYPSANNQILLYHHCMGHDYSDWLAANTDFKIMVYHNITPAHYFAADSYVHRYCIIGREMLQQWSEQDLFQAAIADSEHNARELEQYNYQHIKVIPLLVEAEKVLRQEYNSDIVQTHQDCFSLLFVGRISEHKCQHDLIEILQQLTTMTRQAVELLMVGSVASESYHQQLLTQIEQHQLNAYVTITGKVDAKTLYSYYRCADVFVCMSEHEGFGMPLVEAMLLDIPVIAYDSPDSNVAATMGAGGIIFKQKQPAAIAACISLLIKNPPFRRAIIKSQRENIKRFQSDTLLRQLAQYLKTLDVTLQPFAVDAEKKPLQSVKWQIEGPFDSSYSLALLNREMACSLLEDKQDVSLLSTEGYGDFIPKQHFIAEHPLLKQAWQRSQQVIYPDIVLRYLYPPRTDKLQGRINIMHNYGWEESGFPCDYVQQFNQHLDAVTVMSAYVKKVLHNNGIKIPVHVVGVGVDHILKQPAGKKIKLQKNFNFLHISSCFPRKGVDVLLHSYGSQFSAKDDVCLLIKTFPNPHNNIEQQIAALRSSHADCPDIQLINKDLSPADMRSLYQACDALVAPSRGEGFGLPMAEAMLFNVPVITTGYGGQVDFCTIDNSWLIDYSFSAADTHMELFNSCWVEPDAQHLSQLMAQVYRQKKEQSPDLQQKTHLARQTIEAHFLWKHVRQRTYNALDMLEQQAMLDNKHYKIGWVSSWNSKCGIAEYSRLLVSGFSAEDIIILADSNALLTAEDKQNVKRCWESGGKDDLNKLYEVIIQQKINRLVLQFNFSFFGIKQYARLLTRLKEKNIKCYSFFHSTADVCGEQEKQSLGDMKEALKASEALMVHGIADLNQLKSFSLVDNVVLFPHGVTRLKQQDEAQNYELKQVLQDKKYPKLNGFLRTEKGHIKKLKHKTIIASYGFLLPHKGIKNLLQAFEKVKQQHRDCILLLMNAIYPVPASTQEQADCLQLIEASKYAEDIIMINDFLSEALINALLSRVDYVVFPYETTQESSSAAIRAGIRTTKPVICTPLSIFDDVADIVHFLPGVSSSDLSTGLIEIMHKINHKPSRQMQRQSQWIKEHNWPTLSQRLKNILYQQ